MDKLAVLHALYLAYVLVLLPWLVFRTRATLRGGAATAQGVPRKAPSRERILVSTLTSLLLLFGMSWMVAQHSRIELFALPAPGARELAAAAAALLAHFGLRRIAVALHTPEELRRSLVLAWMPRTAREWGLWVPVAIAAGVAEEASYRGVVWSLLTVYTGNAWLAAAISIASFGLAHATQSWKSVAVIMAIAALMHALVAFTGTLVLAMAVHALYDLAVAVIIGRKATQRELEAAQCGPAAPGE